MDLAEFPELLQKARESTRMFLSRARVKVKKAKGPTLKSLYLAVMDALELLVMHGQYCDDDTPEDNVCVQAGLVVAELDRSYPNARLTLPPMGAIVSLEGFLEYAEERFPE